MYILMIASTFAFFAASILLLRDSVLLSAKKTYKTQYMAVGILCLIAGLYRLFASMDLYYIKLTMGYFLFRYTPKLMGPGPIDCSCGDSRAFMRCVVYGF